MLQQSTSPAAESVVSATNDGMVLLLRSGGVHELGEVMSGIAQGCPLAGALFVSAMDRWGATLRTPGERMCAVDTALVIRAARLLTLLAPVFHDADRLAVVRSELA